MGSTPKEMFHYSMEGRSRMILYGLNNIVKCGREIYFIDLVGERLHLRNENPIWLYGVTLDEIDRDLIEDIDLSDWLLDNIFKKDKEDSWIVDSLHTVTSDIPYFRIEKEESGEAYLFTREGKFIMYIDYVRELQNAYHFFSDIEGGEFLNDDIDKKIKKLFKLI